MTESALTALVNNALASGQPITAAVHRTAEGYIIAELYDGASRAAVVLGVDEVAATLETGDKILIKRGAVGKLIDQSAFATSGGGTEHFRGSHSLVSNAYPSSGGSGSDGAIQAGDEWYVSVAGTLNLPGIGVTDINTGALIKALVNTPGSTNTNWKVTQ